MPWKTTPTIIDKWDDDANYVAFIDENGDADLKHIINCVSNNIEVDDNSRYFNLTSVLLKKDNHEIVEEGITKIKNKHWNDGKYDYKGTTKRICFHSKEIRRQLGAFSKNEIDNNVFMADLNKFMQSLPISISSCFIDKYELYKKYSYASKSPYCLASEFILERLVSRQLKDTDKVIIILESRGKKEDKEVLNSIMQLIEHGTYYVSSKQFKKITGVYFNPKRKGNEQSYFGLEIADLCSYPIFKYCKYNNADEAFKLIETKIYGYPNIKGYGLKKFPK